MSVLQNVIPGVTALVNMAPSLPSSLYGFHDTKAWGRLMATPEWIALRNPILFTFDSQFHSLVHGTKDNVE